MSEGSEPLHLLERSLATTLRQGTWLATGVVALGLLLAWVAAALNPALMARSMSIVNIGLFAFILLPTARVGLMMVSFLRRRDYRFAGAAACVLAIIALGFLAAFYA